MSSSAVAPIKRPRNFQTPTADASTPGELDRAAPLNKPDKHRGTSRASRRHHECVSPCWNMQPGHTPGEVFYSLPPTHLAAARRSYAPSSHSFSQEGSRSITRPLSQRLPWKVSPEGNLQRSDSPSHCSPHILYVTTEPAGRPLDSHPHRRH